MSIGTGIALFVIGAILAFAVEVDVPGVNLDVIGYLLMGAGAIVFIIGLILAVRKRESTTTVRSAVDPATGESVQRRSTSARDDIV